MKKGPALQRTQWGVKSSFRGGALLVLPRAVRISRTIVPVDSLFAAFSALGCDGDHHRHVRNGFDGSVERLRAAHPRFGADAAHPIREARDETQILDDMLLADQPDWNLSSGRDCERCAEKTFGHKDALGVVPERPVPEVRCDQLALVKPAVEGQIVLCHAAKATGGGEGVMPGMGHVPLPQNACSKDSTSSNRWL
jgi:hypothetical protein